MFRKKKFLIGGLILVLAIGYLGYTGFVSSATYYYSVSEFTAQVSSLQGTTVKVNGLVETGSVERVAGSRTIKFNIVEGDKSLTVIYQGTVPDTFKEGNEVVVEGVLDQSGTFQASNIMTKCASKYVPG